MKRITTVEDLRQTVRATRRDGRRIGLVPTMGALHEGHLELVRVARDRCDLLVVSVFVNPTQFDRPDDLAAYPRDLDGDEAALQTLGEVAPDLVFAPAVEEVYPRDPATRVHVEHLTDVLEGASRPGHFDGVATVVTKLFNLVQPDIAAFGRKDFQQLLVIRRVVADLDVPVEIVGVPTVREHDGLARSSRNRRLDHEGRTAAAALSRGLRGAVLAAREDRAAGRAPDPTRVREAVMATLDAVPAVVVDYVEVVDPDTLAPPDLAASLVRGDAPRGEAAGSPTTSPPTPGPSRHLLVAVAAFVSSPGAHQAGGDVRLIDNVEVGDTEDEDRLLAATGDATPHQ
ncbi:MAG: pantoate--beta-alanine ligase [Egicoccus sp.]